MKKILSLLVFSFSLFVSPSAHADEGMWVMGNLSAKTDSILRSLGLELSPDELYSSLLMSCTALSTPRSTMPLCSWEVSAQAWW